MFASCARSEPSFVTSCVPRQLRGFENRLGDIETDCRDRLHVWLLRIGGLNSTHIHGTSVPVEEPSTASKADSCTAANDALTRSPRRARELGPVERLRN